jgi:hypothetical protein
LRKRYILLGLGPHGRPLFSGDGVLARRGVTTRLIVVGPDCRQLQEPCTRVIRLVRTTAPAQRVYRQD